MSAPPAPTAPDPTAPDPSAPDPTAADLPASDLPGDGPARRLIVVRHGRTAWNAAGRYQGHADPPLDEVGRAQSAGVARALAPLRPDLLVTSDLARSVATAVPLAQATGLVPVIEPRLREVDLGAWQGLTRAEAAARFPEEMARWDAGIDVARGGGERRTVAGRRAAQALIDHLASVPPGSLVVAVSHGLVIRAALRELWSLGVISLGEDPTHLANGTWTDLAVARLPDGRVPPPGPDARGHSDDGPS